MMTGFQENKDIWKQGGKVGMSKNKKQKKTHKIHKGGNGREKPEGRLRISKMME